MHQQLLITLSRKNLQQIIKPPIINMNCLRYEYESAKRGTCKDMLINHFLQGVNFLLQSDIFCGNVIVFFAGNWQKSLKFLPPPSTYPA